MEENGLIPPATAQGGIESELGIDPVALRARYRQERDRRVRPEALGQYVEMTGEFAHLAEDPYVEPGFHREALTDEVEVLIVGGGLGGIMLGAHLREQGIQDIRIVERGGDFGGVWYWNRYPGAACDTQAILYLPMLEELGVAPPRRFATGSEIRDHFQTIARHFDLYRGACFQTEVTGVAWDEAQQRWIVSTNRGDAIRARFVGIALGPMERPKLPGIPGIGTFKGRSFHTSRWDYGYTGGGPAGSLTGLADKTVAIIGTGATAIQCVPYLAEDARQLYVVQRTPSSVDRRDDAPLDPQWLASLGPGWQRRLWENFTAQTSGILTETDLVKDGWTSVMAMLRQLVARKAERGEPVEDAMTLSPLADFAIMSRIRDRVDQEVENPEAAALLKPWYDRFCKRPCFSDTYLQTFNRANVTLLDSSADRGVERITENGIVVAGHEYPVDCLIYSTGFDVTTPFARRIGYPIYGRGGITLADKWAGGAATQHGVATRGFPNLFLMSVVQTGVSLNFAHMIDEQSRHIAYIVGEATRRGVRTVEVSAEAEADWCTQIDRNALNQEAFLRECTPSYFNYEGDLAQRNIRNNQYGAGPIAFYRLLAEWRDAGTLPGLELSSASPATAGLVSTADQLNPAT